MATYQLDKFLRENYLNVYNLDFRYKMQDVGTDMNYNLVPATYANSVDLAVLTKYLWFDVYGKIVYPDFLKLYGPRIIHLIGSPAYNPTSGTMILGLANLANNSSSGIYGRMYHLMDEYDPATGTYGLPNTRAAMNQYLRKAEMINTSLASRGERDEASAQLHQRQVVALDVADVVDGAAVDVAEGEVVEQVGKGANVQLAPQYLGAFGSHARKVLHIGVL